jgi:DNA-binding MarR family transcriptional regulator
MLAQGLICRAWSTVDQRRSIISLSPEGEALVARVQPKVEERYEHIEVVLGDQRMQALYEMLDEILMLLPLDGDVEQDEEEAKPARKRSKASAK